MDRALIELGYSLSEFVTEVSGTVKASFSQDRLLEALDSFCQNNLESWGLVLSHKAPLCFYISTIRTLEEKANDLAKKYQEIDESILTTEDQQNLKIQLHLLHATSAALKNERELAENLNQKIDVLLSYKP